MGFWQKIFRVEQVNDRASQPKAFCRGYEVVVLDTFSMAGELWAKVQFPDGTIETVKQAEVFLGNY